MCDTNSRYMFKFQDYSCSPIIYEGWYVILPWPQPFAKEEVRVHKTSWTPQFVIDVHKPHQANAWLCMCVLRQWCRDFVSPSDFSHGFVFFFISRYFSSIVFVYTFNKRSSNFNIWYGSIQLILYNV